MIDLAWTSTILIFAAAGLVIWPLPEIKALDVAARISVALACGLVIVSIILYAESLGGLSWSPLALFVPVALVASAGALGVRRTPSAERSLRWPLAGATAFAAIALLAFYGAATARITIADLLLFWGPKAQHFFHARAIDVEFLKFPHYFLMHSDYPPLVPVTWAASSIVVGRFSWWGAVYTTPIVFIAAALAFRGFAAPRIGATRSVMFAALLLATITFASAASVSRIAGGADAYLLLFETVALSALTFTDSRGGTAVAAIALAGAAFTKVEGAAFVVAIVVALLLVRRFTTAVAVAVPALVLLGSWIAFASHHELLDSYRRAERELHVDNLGLVLQIAFVQLSYRAAYLPWIAVIAPLAFGRAFRRAALPLLVAVASISYSLYFYLGEPDPIWWIRSSVERVMLTPLMCFAVASAAASE